MRHRCSKLGWADNHTGGETWQDVGWKTDYQNKTGCRKTLAPNKNLHVPRYPQKAILCISLVHQNRICSFFCDQKKLFDQPFRLEPRCNIFFFSFLHPKNTIMPLPPNATAVVAAINAVVTHQEGAGLCFLLRRVSARSLSGFPPRSLRSPPRDGVKVQSVYKELLSIHERASRFLWWLYISSSANREAQRGERR